ncbi:YgaP-like transmembrane domain [Haloarcula marina]|uniref:YgaP-like transmembrane domain n=1 Tax=Haloarcula marina TaxID=2961574 RepID=UPI0020B7B676|nr:YgaP-like transmembrane domain [Halomicroarcula marina]
MDVTENVGGRDRLARAVLAVILTIAAIRSLRNGKRFRGLLAAAGAVAFGYTASTKYCGVNDALGVDTSAGDDDVEVAEIDADTTDDAGDSETADADSEPVVIETDAGADSRSNWLTCAACGDPIRSGQSRGPNADGDIVHDDCN